MRMERGSSYKDETIRLFGQVQAQTVILMKHAIHTYEDQRLLLLQCEALTPIETLC